MKHLKPLLVVWSFLLALSGSAAETNATKIDPTGTWKWSTAVVASQAVEAQLKLRLLDGKLTGVAIGPDQKELPLEQAEFKDGRIRFEVTRTMQGKKFTTIYQGTIAGDRLTGRASNGSGRFARSLPWEALRIREEVSPPPARGAPPPPAVAPTER